MTTSTTGKATFSFTTSVEWFSGSQKIWTLQDQFRMMISKIHWEIQRFNEVRAGDLKSKMLQKGNDNPKDIQAFNK
jgi:hypothetical protein